MPNESGVPETLHLPSAYPSDTRASVTQRAAVELFYASSSFGDLSHDQASILLDYREYACAVVDRMAPSLFGEDRREAAEFVAIYISRDREIAEAVSSMMRRRFEQGADPDGLKRAITRLQYFEDIEAHAERVLDGQ